MKTWILDYSLWIYGLLFGLMGTGFAYLDKGKVSKETFKAINDGFDARLESMDNKLDKLIDIHLKNGSNIK